MFSPQTWLGMSIALALAGMFVSTEDRFGRWTRLVCVLIILFDSVMVIFIEIMKEIIGRS